MEPISDLTIGHIGQRIHVRTDQLDHTGVLVGIDVQTGIADVPTYGTPDAVMLGRRERFALRFMPETLIDTVNLDRAAFEVLDQ